MTITTGYNTSTGVDIGTIFATITSGDTNVWSSTNTFTKITNIGGSGLPSLTIYPVGDTTYASGLLRTGLGSRIYFYYNWSIRGDIGGSFKFYYGNDADTSTSFTAAISSTGVYSQNSDLRLKTNINTIPYGLNHLLQLNPVSYNFKNQIDTSDNTLHLGLIAQDVKVIIPEVVTYMDDENDYLGISYSLFIPILIKAIKDQNDIINAQAIQISDILTRLNNGGI